MRTDSGVPSASGGYPLEMLQGFRTEVAPLLRLAWPLVLAELGWMTMGLVDTIFVGRLSTAALAGVSLGGIIFYSVAVFGIGLLLGLDTLVSQAFGAGEREECERWAMNGIWLAVLTSPFLMGVVWALVPLLSSFGVQPEVVREAAPFLNALNWSLLPLLLFTAVRRYLQSMNIVAPTMVMLLTANVINAVADWALVFGHLGFAPMGSVGAGLATSASRIYMLFGLAAYVSWRKLWPSSYALERRRLFRLIVLGVPVAMQITLELSLFAVAAVLIGHLPTIQLAAHQVALNVVSYTFMVPLGLSSAAAVRVGQAIGRKDAEGARRAGWTAIAIGAAFMGVAGILFLANRHVIIRIFTADAAVIDLAATLLIAGAAFQLFDGTQAVATGALRGLADTTTPMVTHLIGYWFFGLPIGYWLCFHGNWGAMGMWIGFCASLMAIGMAMAFMWRRRSEVIT